MQRYPFWSLLALSLALAPGGCFQRKDPEETGAGPIVVRGDLEFGAVPSGLVRSLVLQVSTRDGTAPEVNGAVTGLGSRTIQAPEDSGSPHLVVVSCDPAQLASTSGEIYLRTGAGDVLTVPWSCSEGARTPDLPSPAAVSIGVQAIAMNEESGLGRSGLQPDDGGHLFQSPATGDTFLTDPVAGRVWRQNLFYLVPTWGAWVNDDMSYAAPWDPVPDCFDGSWTYQSGTCTGLERNLDGTVPPGFSYYHGGFIDGNGVSLEGVRTGVALPDAELLLLAGERDSAGFLAVVDAGIVERLEDEQPYSYMRLVRPVAGQVPEDLELAPGPGLAWAFDRVTSTLYEVTGLDTTTPTVALSTTQVSGILNTGPDREGLLLWGTGGALHRLDSRGLTSLPVAEGLSSLNDKIPALLAGDGTLTWAWFPDPGVLAWRDDTGESTGILAVPRDFTPTLLRADRIEGGTAAPSAMAWFVARVEGGSSLLVAQAGSDVVESTGIALPMAPVALSVDPWPHDVFVAYPSSSEGCTGDLADTCTDGTHPALIASYYAPYGLVPPTSTGHRLNLFMNPILETPKDHQVNTDFSRDYADCSEPPEGLTAAQAGRWSGCCAQDWANHERVMANLDYFLGAWAETIGADTEDPADDVKVVLGVNPTWMRQARECLVDSGEVEEWGLTTLQTLADYRDRGLTFTNWTHTSMADDGADDDFAWFIGLVTDGWEPPLDDMEDYALLHQGLAAVWDYDALGTVTIGGTPVDLRDLELSFIAAAGNSFDGSVMIENGWEDPSWVSAVRDGPLAVGWEPTKMFYFASAGALVEIDLLGYRKKELFPLDVRDRNGLFPMGEDPNDWYLTDDADMAYAPGSNWEVGTIYDVARSGLYRESLSWGVQVSTDNWEMIHRYLRRILASSEADDVKSWYLHIYDISSSSGLFEKNSEVTPELDINVDALERINADYVTPGHARWSTLDDIWAEWEARGAR